MGPDLTGNHGNVRMKIEKKKCSSTIIIKSENYKLLDNNNIIIIPIKYVCRYFLNIWPINDIQMKSIKKYLPNEKFFYGILYVFGKIIQS